MAKGGYLQVYDIFDGEKRIGGKTVQRLDRTQPQTMTYVLITPGQKTELSDQPTFDNLKDFAAAYEASLDGS